MDVEGGLQTLLRHDLQTASQIWNNLKGNQV